MDIEMYGAPLRWWLSTPWQPTGHPVFFHLLAIYFLGNRSLLFGTTIAKRKVTEYRRII